VAKPEQSGGFNIRVICLVMGVLAKYTNIWYRRKVMARNTNITLGSHFDDFIAAQVENGRYGSASEVVRAGLRLLEETEGKLERLRRLLDEGEKSGITEYSYENVIAELDNEAR
jgi:antitoxin ParD1/3/4